jgi:hypothetical protein
MQAIGCSTWSSPSGPGEARGDEHRELRFLTVDELLAREPIPLTASIIALARAHPEVSTWLDP